MISQLTTHVLARVDACIPEARILTLLAFACKAAGGQHFDAILTDSQACEPNSKNMSPLVYRPGKLGRPNNC